MRKRRWISAVLTKWKLSVPQAIKIAQTGLITGLAVYVDTSEYPAATPVCSVIKRTPVSYLGHFLKTRIPKTEWYVSQLCRVSAVVKHESELFGHFEKEFEWDLKNLEIAYRSLYSLLVSLIFIKNSKSADCHPLYNFRFPPTARTLSITMPNGNVGHTTRLLKSGLYRCLTCHRKKGFLIK